jgi:hypothetical protein
MSLKFNISFLFFGLFLANSLFAELRSTVPTVKFTGRTIAGFPGKEHSPNGQNIELLDSEDCNSKVTSKSTIEVSDNCSFLHGVYRYIFIPSGERVRHQILIDFSLSKSSGKSHTFLVNAPLEIDESSVTALPR